jgi:hypothetical protein
MIPMTFHKNSVLFLALLSCFAMALPCHAHGNGGVRGGGDIYAAEFQEVERGILLKIDAWQSSKVLNISTDDLARVKAIQKIHDVTSQPHACLELRVDAQGNCVVPTDERDVVNDPLSNPPRVIIGRNHWDGYKSRPLDKETLVLHEMLEVALTKSAQLFVDKTFETSYATKLSTLKAWETFRSHHMDMLRDLHRDNQDIDGVDFTPVHSFLMGVNSGSDYKNCLKSKGTNKNARKKQDQYCKPLAEIFINSLTTVLEPDGNSGFARVQKQVDEDKQNHQEWLDESSVDESWQAWARTQYLNYDIAMQRATTSYNSTVGSADDVKTLLDTTCPQNGDLSFAISCAFTQGVPALEKLLGSAIDAYVNQIDASYNSLVNDSNAQIDPPN